MGVKLPRATRLVITINGEKRYLWRAVDQHGYVLDEIVQVRRNTGAAKRLLERLLRKQGCPPRRMITDKLSSYAAVKRKVMPNVEHRQHKGLNNRAENSHVVNEPTYRVLTAVLDHHTPCLAFAIEEAAHLNVWKNRLTEMRLSIGPWLRELKRAVIENKPDDYPIRIDCLPMTSEVRMAPLGVLRKALTVTPGQKIAYVTDIGDTAANRTAVATLIRNADLLFIEAAFAQADVELAAERAHLNTTAAGSIAREAGARRIEPFHFSPRYAGQEERMLSEVMVAFSGRSSEGRGP